MEILVAIAGAVSGLIALAIIYFLIPKRFRPVLIHRYVDQAKIDRLEAIAIRDKAYIDNFADAPAHIRNFVRHVAPDLPPQIEEGIVTPLMEIAKGYGLVLLVSSRGTDRELVVSERDNLDIIRKEIEIYNDPRVRKAWHTLIGVFTHAFLVQLPDAAKRTIQGRIPFHIPFSFNAELFLNTVHHEFHALGQLVNIPQPARRIEHALYRVKKNDPVYFTDTPLSILSGVNKLLAYIPDETRFEHHWIVAPPKSGKSNTLSYMIDLDLDEVASGRGSVVVMESNRDLVTNLAKLKRFAPGGDLHGKLIYINLEDVEYPLSINLFDTGKDTGLSPLERAVFRNTTLSMLEYVFRALLAAELTSRMSTVFTFVTQLLLEIPSANLDTFADLMKEGGLAKYREYLPKLSADARDFFETKFDDPKDRYIRDTRSVILDRIYTIKKNDELAAIISATETKLNLYEELGQGKVILINLAKVLLQQEGTELLGRFFVAMILAAAQRRQFLPIEQRLPTYVYIDECQDIIKRDEKLPVLLDQARKLRVAMILAHQRIDSDQINPTVFSALCGSTGIKMAAKISDANASALARNMRTTADFIMNQPPFTFAAFVQDETATAGFFKAPPTDFTKMPHMTKEEEATTKDTMRKQYARRLDTPPRSPPPPPNPRRRESDIL